MRPQNAVIGLSVFLCACGGPPTPPSKLVQPAKRCMVAPGKLAIPQAGDDLTVHYAAAVKSYGRETSKVRCLQKWVRTATK